MAINVNDLPPKYQSQAYQKYMSQRAKKSKYHNVPTERVTPAGNKIRFDSKKEAKRYDELLAMLKAGEIRDLRLQVEFTLQAAYTTHDGQRIRAIRYKSDFAYYTADGEYIVEDVKSRATQTPQYSMKKKLMAGELGIQIREV